MNLQGAGVVVRPVREDVQAIREFTRPSCCDLFEPYRSPQGIDR